MTTRRILPLHEYPDDVQAAICWYSERERSAGWVKGYEFAQREFWNLPSYEDAVDAIIDIGTFGINKRAAARRAEVSK